MKYKEKYKTGMIFRSKKYPWADIMIDYVTYNRMAESSYEFNIFRQFVGREQTALNLINLYVRKRVMIMYQKKMDVWILEIKQHFHILLLVR